jgi:hypothetical protein
MTALPLKVQPVAAAWLNGWEMLCAKLAAPGTHANSVASNPMVSERRQQHMREMSAAQQKT